MLYSPLVARLIKLPAQCGNGSWELASKSGLSHSSALSCWCTNRPAFATSLLGPPLRYMRLRSASPRCLPVALGSKEHSSNILQVPFSAVLNS